MNTGQSHRDPVMLVGLGATRAAWSAELRAYIRNHLTGMTAETVLDRRQLRRPGGRPLDVLIVDDVTRIFHPADIAEVEAAGTVVFGLFDTEAGMGRRYLEDLGVSRLLETSTPVADLAARVAEIGPTNAVAAAGPTGESRDHARPAGSRGVLSVWTSVSGGAGLSELVLAAAELSSKRGATLLVEANPISAVLAARLGRDHYYGLGWTLARVGQGHPGLPKGLTPAWSEEARRKIGFDVICQTVAPGGPPSANPGQLGTLIGQALAGYDTVMVEVGPTVGPSPAGGADRFAAGRAMLVRADRVVVLAGPDPESAARLAEWAAAAAEWGISAPKAVAVFARLAGRFEGTHLKGVVENSTGERFTSVHLLPEDPAVAKARWNGDMVRRGRWHNGVARLVDELSQTPASAPVPPATAARRPSLAREVGLR